MALMLNGRILSECLPMKDAIAAVECALSERSARTAISPARTRWEFPPSAMTITPGGFRTMGTLGFRVYVRGEADDQVTAVWNLHDGHLEGIVTGPELGQIRTGAVGGVAMKWMAPENTRRVAIIGGGPQSRTQLLALKVVRPAIEEVFVYRRNADRRNETARRLSRESGLEVEPVDSVRKAVREAQVVVLATNSSTPVIEAQWLLPGAHVNSLGPKYRGQSEIGMDLLEKADWLVCDFPEQYRQEEDFIAQGTPHVERLRDLAELVASHPARSPELSTLFLSHGLAGTEVAVAHRALMNAASLGMGTQMSP